MAWELAGNAATVAQLAGLDSRGLMSKIWQAAETAQQNKRECDHLARRVNTIAELLPHVEEQLAAPTRAELGNILREAHELVMACQGKSRACRFLTAGRQADKFRDVQTRIDSYLSVFPVINLIGISGSSRRRLYDGTGTGNNVVLAPPPLPSQSDLDMDQPAVVVGREFTVAELTLATDNFALALGVKSDDSGSGSGSGTTMYMGRLGGDGRRVVVKRIINNGVRRAEDVFGTELALLSPLRHDHIVRLLGWCAEKDARLLVYDYEQLEKGTLRDHLRRPAMSSSASSSPPPSPVTTSWRTRLKVLLGVACAIEHLHCHSVPLIIHRNITSSNILLDGSWTPRVTGFAASVWREPPEMGPQIVVVGDDDGRMDGYTDPEYLSSGGHLKPASDVYNLGVLMLEVLTGNPPVVQVWEETKKKMVAMSLVSWALPSISCRRLRDVLDRRPAASMPTPRQLQALELVANTAACCLWVHGDNRPAISQVVANLRQALSISST